MSSKLIDTLKNGRACFFINYDWRTDINWNCPGQGQDILHPWSQEVSILSFGVSGVKIHTRGTLKDTSGMKMALETNIEKPWALEHEKGFER